MRSPSPRILALAAVAAAGMLGGGGPAGMAVPASMPRDPDLMREPSWSIPTLDAVRERALTWLAASGGDAAASAAALARADAAWEKATADGDLLAAAFETVAAGDPRAEAVCGAGEESPDLAWLAEPSTPAFVREVVRLWWGRELVRHDRFDEALPFVADLDVATSVDPAAVLFTRAACQHWLLDRDAALETLDRLLERETEIPMRYARVARLLRADMAALETDSLDHIARRMRDVTRRLGHGRAGSATRDVQDGVIASLDKLIKQIEDQQQQGQGQGAAGAGADGGSGQGGAGRPMEDSRPAGGRGAGEVQKRNLSAGDAWGNLPPHDRERALQQIGREFPPHYREAIEHYFKRLAAGEEDR
jgi:hypothetical protein